MPTPSDRQDRILAVEAALRKQLSTHGLIASHMVSDFVLDEAAETAVDAITAYEKGKVI